eukprot:TRINITY_DN6639_c0_g1_i4.p1 TRINITY_DN6639_c0_g1~~TRINITY_DN6639_c0_g1_i4.p1  ORF type:complete len:120 (-),score=43.97 TRINITY_DN6639_c0_g1_i4:163-495(-)
MIRRPPRSTPLYSSAASDVYKRQVLAIKYNDDHYYDNEVYARVGGIPLNEFNTLEARVLQMMDCTLYVSENLFCQYYHALLLQFQNEYGGEKRWAEETLEGEIMTSYESC